jgi:hypothetical protein
MNESTENSLRQFERIEKEVTASNGTNRVNNNSIEEV